MTGFLYLPRDVHWLVWKLLTLKDVASLRQVSSEYATLIASDKQLWTYIFERDVKARGLCFPSNLRPIEEVTATQVESWVKHACSLEKRYSTPDLKPIALRVEITGRVTWAELLRGRWCLIASADSASSELSIWDISSSSEICLRAKVHLRGPVFDGQVEDTGDFIHVAMTIATTVPSILIYSIHKNNEGDVVFIQLAEIAGAAQTLMLKGPYVGFATRNGDDTFPFIYNWKTSSSVELRYPVEQRQTAPTPLPIERCAAMAIWTSFVIVILRSDIQIFYIEWTPEISKTSFISSATPFTTIAIPKSLCFHESINIVNAGDAAGRCSSVMHWYLQEWRSHPRLLLLLRSDNTGKDFKISCIEDPEHEGEPDDDPLSYLAIARSCVGTTSKRIFLLSTQKSFMDHWIPPKLMTAPVHTITGRIETGKVQYHGVHMAMGDPIHVSRDGLPLPHVVSCLDFDDGCGIALLGTLSGEFCLAFFIEKDILAPESLLHELPLVDHQPSVSPSSLFKDTVELDVPAYYMLRVLIPNKDTDSPLLIKEALRLWSDPYEDLPQIAGWSNDWSRFTKIWDWIVPFSPWTTDSEVKYFEQCVHIRQRLRTFGDIKPILYYERNHSRVVFRIGERLFYSKWEPDDDDDDDFVDEQETILGVLPMTYSQFRGAEPFAIETMLSDFWIQRNLNAWSIGYVAKFHLYLRSIFRSARDQLGKSVERSAREMLELWSDSQWKEIFDARYGKR